MKPMEEYDEVELINNVNSMPAGASGIIVWVYEGVNAYDVKFDFTSKGFNIHDKIMTVQGIDLKRKKHPRY